MAQQTALTVAGVDPSGGAGVAADLKTFQRFRVYGMSAVTLLTVQNTQGVTGVEVCAPELVARQLDACFVDLPVHAMKTGALGNAGVIGAVAAAVSRWRAVCVVDPVMLSKHGAALLDAAAVDAFGRDLLPRARLVTPNLPEASALLGRPVEKREDMAAAARELAARFATAVLLKGGHLADGPAADILVDGGLEQWFEAPRIASRHTHGTGCTYSAAITAQLALGQALPAAVGEAKRFVTAAIASAPGLGRGHGPLNFFA